ncbi:MAG: response regulator transcription factor [Aquabacterium sp.]|nr:MAG: response regulator transcription factor [Aquabacterium sp.]
MRAGLRRILADMHDISLVHEAPDGVSALRLMGKQSTRLALVDLCLPGMAGVELIRRIRADLPRTRILVLSMHADAHHAVRALRAGANGYLTKDCAPAELALAIRKVAAGGAYLPDALSDSVAVELSGQAPGAALSQLSNREFQVYELLLAGRRVTDIAKALHLSVKTVSSHKTHILEKTGIGSLAELVRYGIEHGPPVVSTGTQQREARVVVVGPQQPGRRRRALAQRRCSPARWACSRRRRPRM